MSTIEEPTNKHYRRSKETAKPKNQKNGTTPPQIPHRLFGLKARRYHRTTLKKILNLYYKRPKKGTTKKDLVKKVSELESTLDKDVCDAIAWLVSTQKQLTRMAIEKGAAEEKTAEIDSGTEEEDLEEIENSDDASEPEPEVPSHLFGQEVDKLKGETLKKILNLYYKHPHSRETKNSMALKVAELENQLPEQTCETIGWLLKTRRLLTRDAIKAGIVEDKSSDEETIMKKPSEKSARKVAEKAVETADEEAEESPDSLEPDEEELMDKSGRTKYVKAVNDKPIPFPKIATTTECVMCKEKISGENLFEGVIAAECIHRDPLCKECVRGSLEAQIGTGKRNLDCPVSGCTQQLSILETKNTISTEAFDRYLGLLK